MKRGWAIRCSVLCGLWVLVMQLGSAAAADKNAKYFQEKFDHWSKVIADLKEADVSEGATQDIEMIRTWLGQSQAYLASEKLTDIEPILKKIEAQAEYIRAKVNRMAAEDAADESEALASSSQEQAQKAKQAADKAVAHMKQLEAKGL